MVISEYEEKAQKDKTIDDLESLVYINMPWNGVPYRTVAKRIASALEKAGYRKVQQ